MVTNAESYLCLSIRDTSDYMYDLGPILQLIAEKQAWWLCLSLVGRFAMFTRMGGSDGNEMYFVLSDTEDCKFIEEKKFYCY
jgi:hypothetical protein